jgi:hypothetical protein
VYSKATLASLIEYSSDPIWLYSCVFTEVLNLTAGGFAGSLPSSIANLLLLQELMLGNNTLSGRIPSGVQLLVSLKVLDLSTNFFTGTIPTVMGFLQSLTDVELGTNAFTGSVPSELCKIAADPTLFLHTLVVDCGGKPPLVACQVPACCSNCTPHA